MSDAEFIAFIWAFYAKNKRDFPWRQTRDPYAILVSELMLQQTQTQRVIPKYTEWMKRFPTVDVLSKAALAEVLTMWSGLGYNRRAKFLQASAKTMRNAELKIKTKELKGENDKVKTKNGIHNSKLLIRNVGFPNTFKELTALPGIGEYTANAILAFAFNQPTVVVETNIRTVIIHHFFADQTDVSDKAIKEVLARVVSREKPRDWYYALMDYGNSLKLSGVDHFHKQKGYVKQKPFKGSERYVRGYLLRETLKHNTLKLADIHLPGYEDKIIYKIAEDLAKEGLILKDSDSVYSVTD